MGIGWIILGVFFCIFNIFIFLFIVGSQKGNYMKWINSKKDTNYKCVCDWAQDAGPNEIRQGFCLEHKTDWV